MTPLKTAEKKMIGAESIVLSQHYAYKWMVHRI